LPFLRCRFGDHRVGLDLYFDLGSLLELNFLPMGVGETVGNPNLAIEMIGTLDRDLSLFWFTGSRMSVYYLFHFTWECGTCFRSLGRHNRGPPLGRTLNFEKVAAIAGKMALDRDYLNSST
jgi:hypothetical protein